MFSTPLVKTTKNFAIKVLYCIKYNIHCTLVMESSTFGHVTDWNEVIKKEARGQNDADLGEVLEVKDDIVVTERGTLNKEKFYLPKSIPHGFNGHALLFDITEEEAKERFMNDPALTQETEIELTHEELIIEKRPIEDNITSSSSSSSPTPEIVQSKTEISIPLKREDII